MLTDFGRCVIPVSAKITIDSSGRMSAEYEYSTIGAKELTDFLLAGLGVDVDQIGDER